MKIVPRLFVTSDMLFADLENDEIAIDAETIGKAKNGDSDAINSIGWKYCNEKQQYHRAMDWYRLAAVKNNASAQNNIGTLYYSGHGVPKDHQLALEWYLKSAIQNYKAAWVNIGLLFEVGEGVPLNKHKALEWYSKSALSPERVKALTEEGIHLTEHAKDKPIEQLMMETENILWEERNERSEEIHTLKLLKNIAEEQLRTKTSQYKENIKAYQLKLENKQKDLDIFLVARNKREEYLKRETNTVKMKAEEELRAKDTKIKTLEQTIQTYQLTGTTTGKRDKNSDDQQSQLIHQYKRENEKLKNDMETLKLKNSTLTTQMEVKDLHIKALEKEITVIRIICERPIESATARVEEVEKSNQNLKELLDQERRLKENAIMLMKQEMEACWNKEKNGKRQLGVEGEATENRAKRVKLLPKGNSVANSSDGNENQNQNNNEDNDDEDANADGVKIETL